MDNFLPADYEVPVKPGKYMKFQDGENRFRILDTPIMGWEWWVHEDGSIVQRGEKRLKGDKPVRCRMSEFTEEGATETAKHFWAMKVWNYKDKRVQLLEITQSKIQKPIKTYSKDEDWGSPLGYDLVVTKTGEGLETDYTVTPKPAKPLDKEIKAKSDSTKVNLTALYEGKEPFETSEDVEPSEVNI